MRHTLVPVGDEAAVGGKNIYPGIISILLFSAVDPFAGLNQKVGPGSHSQRRS